ncbi:hypothetical protein AG1IA_01356 [Rhizoctonia solani AG-1 IA]|uniref:Uncharacterized protein n=1 Tax=Thanatephorus cucumeris (strain AG1-IA) TaxID=983506 RepID=L8X7J0_THACA|nr:hypothetical protein AG1IA_01356 [Rhizoctonia solani AG-1 IA]
MHTIAGYPANISFGLAPVELIDGSKSLDRMSLGQTSVRRKLEVGAKMLPLSRSSTFDQ